MKQCRKIVAHINNEVSEILSFVGFINQYEVLEYVYFLIQGYGGQMYNTVSEIVDTAYLQRLNQRGESEVRKMAFTLRFEIDGERIVTKLNVITRPERHEVDAYLDTEMQLESEEERNSEACYKELSKASYNRAEDLIQEIISYLYIMRRDGLISLNREFEDPKITEVSVCSSEDPSKTDCFRMQYNPKTGLKDIVDLQRTENESEIVLDQQIKVVEENPTQI